MSRVQEIMEMIANETDPDKLQVLEFDLRQAMELSRLQFFQIHQVVL